MCHLKNIYRLGTLDVANMRAYHRCSRPKPSYDFHSEGFLNSNPSLEELVQIQNVNLRI